jgi:hypothetical protein
MKTEEVDDTSKSGTVVKEKLCEMTYIATFDAGATANIKAMPKHVLSRVMGM